MNIRRIGGVALLLVLSAVLTLAGPASAASKKTKTQLTPFSTPPGFDDLYSLSGLLDSSKDSCVSGREYQLVGKKGKAKPRTIDRGTSSEDGAVGGFAKVRSTDLKLSFRVPATAGCKGASARVGLPSIMEPLRQRADVGTMPLITGIGSKRSQGAFVGFILLDEKAECFSDRKMTLRNADGDVLDRGRTSRNGGFALHLTEGEYFAGDPFTASVAAGRSGGDNCEAGSATYPDDN